jgi:hypothetical protein
MAAAVPIAAEVREAGTDAVPKVAAALADAFFDDPVYTWLLPRGFRLKSRLREMWAAELEQYVWPNGGTVWTTPGFAGAMAELPPGAWEMPKSVNLTQAPCGRGRLGGEWGSRPRCSG